MNSEQAKQLLQKYRLGVCTDDEKKAIEAWYEKLAETGQWEWTEAEKKSFGETLRARINAEINESKALPKTVNRRFPFFKAAAAAAVIAIIFSTAAYFVFRKTENKTTARQGIEQRYKNDVKPGADGAILTLANGKKIVLDTASDGTLAVQGNANVISKDGQLIYTGTSVVNSEVTYNSIVTPKARQFKLVLSDGTKVWLNAASSIRYPAVFNGASRTVEITGEAYFEVAKVYASVAKNKVPARVPFIVKINTINGGGGQVEVLGTHFNISAYDDDAYVKTTLVEGSVKVKNGDNEALLSPGNQSQQNKKGNLNVIKNADLDATLAWKNGLFSFDKTDIKTVMNQLVRWYDIEVVYIDGHVPDEYFWGDMPRSSKLSSVLKAFEKSGVRFAIEGNRVTVLK